MKRPSYINWIAIEQGITIQNGKQVRCFKIDYNDDEDILNDWALHIRKNYIDDETLVDDASVNDMTVEEYLHEYVIPQKGEPFGATARSGDICEILVSDLLEFLYKFSVPRYKMKNRSGKNNSQQGTDVLAYKFANKDKKPSNNDILVASEVKGELTVESYVPIENAIQHSRKDEYRLARTVDYCRKRLRELGQVSEAKEVTRFLMKPDYNFQVNYIAAGVSSREKVDETIELNIDDNELKFKKNEAIFYIHGKKLMDLAHNIYERCKK